MLRAGSAGCFGSIGIAGNRGGRGGVSGALGLTWYKWLDRRFWCWRRSVGPYGTRAWQFGRGRACAGRLALYLDRCDLPPIPGVQQGGCAWYVQAICRGQQLFLGTGRGAEVCAMRPLRLQATRQGNAFRCQGRKLCFAGWPVAGSVLVLARLGAAGELCRTYPVCIGRHPRGLA